MTGSAPADLAVAFISVPRRLREALGECEDAGSWSGHQRVASVVADAAQVLGVDATIDAIAAELRDRPAEAWVEADLDRVRQLALQLGALVRDAESFRDDSPLD